MRRSAIILSLLICPAAGAAQPICAALQEADASVGSSAAICTTNDMLGGGTQTTCHWRFAYRSPEAKAYFQQMRAQIEACLGPDSALPEDQNVNHPDSFALHQYQGQGMRVALSLKDKAAWTQSLVFLSISPLP